MEALFTRGEVATATLLAFVRLSAFFLAAPVPGTNVPARVRVVLSAALAFAFSSPNPGPEPVGPMWVAAITESILGAAAGFLMTMVLLAFTHAGEQVGSQMGLQQISFVRPLGARVTAFGGFFGIFALALFVLGEGPERMMTFLWRWFEVLPPGTMARGLDGLAIAVSAGRELFVLVLHAGAPMITAVFAAQVVLAVLARAVPTLNLFVEGPALTITTGTLGFLASMHTLLPLVERGFEQRFDELLLWFGL
jgi:flagellar biosynthetic protein FliR